MPKAPSTSLLDERLLRLFDALYATRSVSRAAAMLGQAQPTVSIWLGRLREELETNARDSLERALEELQTQADDRRRTIDELNERLRQHEHAVGEQVDRAESEAHGRIEVAFADLERRQVEQLERALAREIDARSEAGALEFENRMRAIREEAAGRLREELDRIAESFLRRADGLIAAELQHAATAASQRLDDRIVELVRQQEADRPTG